MQAARVIETPVPAARRLQEVAAERARVPELRRRREPARLPQRLGDRGLDLELRERRPRADHAVVDAARYDVADVDEPFRLQQALPQQRHDLRAAVNEDPAIELLEARRPQELHASPSASPRERAAAPRA